MLIRLFMLALLLWSAWPAQAAITDGTSALNKCNATSCSVPIAIGSTDLEVIITVQWFATTTRSASGVTVGGSNATLIDRIEQGSCNGGRCGVEKWRLTNPGVGTPNVDVSFSASTLIILGVKTYAGVDPTTPIGTPLKTTGSAATQSLTLTTTAGDVVDGGLVIVNAGGSPSATGGGQYYSDFDLFGFVHGAASSLAASGASTVYEWTYPTAQAFAILAVALHPAGSGGGGGGLATERLVWTDLSSGQRQETNTRVYWKHLTQPTYQLIATLAPDSTTYTVTYTTQTDRCYVVDQINGAGTSPLSNELCTAITAPGPIRPTLTPASLAGGLSDY